MRSTPLHLAAAGDDPKIVALILQNGGDVNARDALGRTPLHTAIDLREASAGDPRVAVEIAQILIGRGADLNAVADVGTALHAAARRRSPELVDLLLKNGADPEIQTRDAGTPLHTAVATGDPETVEILLMKGVRVNTANSQGYRPLDLAGDYHELRRLLRQHGGKSGFASLSYDQVMGPNRLQRWINTTPVRLDSNAKIFEALKAIGITPELDLTGIKITRSGEEGKDPEIIDIPVEAYANKDESKNLALQPDDSIAVLGKRTANPQPVTPPSSRPRSIPSRQPAPGIPLQTH
jgi:hypothetical protein